MMTVAEAPPLMTCDYSQIMSHYSVMVALPPGSMDRIDPMLDEIMAPWDEDREVDPYKAYQDGEPGDHWFVKAMRRGAKHDRDGTGLIPYNPQMLGWSTEKTKLTPQQQRDIFRRDAEAAEALGDSPDWETVVTAHHARYASDELPDGEDLLYDPVAKKAYQWSTYNPDSKWDYWQIGGRWNRYFKIRAGINQSDQDRIIHKPQHYMDRQILIEPGTCDGGVISALDLAGMRTDAADQAGESFDTWQATLRTFPDTKPWSAFPDTPDGGRQYRAQPGIKAASAFVCVFDCPFAQFGDDREAYMQVAEQSAVSGYALVTLDREWVSPGRVGWFGISSDNDDDRNDYARKVDEYVRGLPADAVLVMLDCHI